MNHPNLSLLSRYKFVFESTEEDFREFIGIVKKGIPESDIRLENYDDHGFHVSIAGTCEIAFKVGIAVSSCYTRIKQKALKS